jgi:hypothetical protein
MDDLTLIALISLEMVFDAVIVSWLSGKWAFRMFIKGMTDGSPEVKDAVASLIGMALFSPIATGKTVKDEDGHEIPETKPLFVFMGRELLRQFELFMRAKSGGNKSGMEAAAAADPELASMMAGGALFGGIRKRRKDEPLMSYILETAVTSPQGQEYIGKIVESKLGALIPK